MKISGTWLKILMAVVPAILGMLNLGEPWNEVIRKLIEWVTNNFQAAGLFGIGLGSAAWALYGVQPKTPEDASLEELFDAMNRGQVAAAKLGIDVSESMGDLSKAASKQAPEACAKIRAAREAKES